MNWIYNYTAAKKENVYEFFISGVEENDDEFFISGEEKVNEFFTSGVEKRRGVAEQ